MNAKTKTKTGTPNAVIYARRSGSGGREESVSIAAQIEEAKRHCKANGWEVAGVFSDEGVSGSILPRQLNPSARKVREGLTEALNVLQEGRASILVAYKLDRVSRLSSSAGLSLFSLVDKIGAKVSLTSETIPEATTATGEFSLTILLSVSALYRRLASERMKQAKAYAKEQGRRVGRVPFGYREEGEKERLVRIFTDYAAGKSIRALCRDMNAEGKSFLGGNWRTQTVKKILRNHTYIGKREDLSPNPAYEPLVPEPLFFKVQKMLTANGNTRATSKQVYVLSGLLTCEKCGLRLSIRRTCDPVTGARYYYYGCIHSKLCGCPTVSIREYDRLARVIVEGCQKTATEDHSAEHAKVERIEKNIADLNSKVASGELDASTFLELKRAAEANKKKILEQVRTVRARTETERKQVEWDALSEAEKRLALYERVELITVAPDKATVKIRKGWGAANPSTHTKAGTFNFLGAGGFDMGEGYRGKGYDFPQTVDFSLVKKGKKSRTFNLNGLAIAVQKIMVETLKDMPTPPPPKTTNPPPPKTTNQPNPPNPPNQPNPPNPPKA